MPLNTPADFPQTDPPRSPREWLPTMYDLPSEDPEEPGLPDMFHYHQPYLLQQTFCPPDYPPDQFFAAGNLNLYYDVHHPLWRKRPDWFAVLGVSRLYDERDLRLSYVVWQEGALPFIVVELLSPGTDKEDLGQTLREVKQPPTKWEVYERILRIPYYVVYDRYTGQLRAFTQTGGRYRQLDLPEPRLWLPEVRLGLGLWSGVYENTECQWLRWYTADNQWIPTTAERLELERQRAEREQKRAERLAAQLRSLGIEPDEL